MDGEYQATADVMAHRIIELTAELDRLRAIEARADWATKDPRESASPTDLARWIRDGA